MSEHTLLWRLGAWLRQHFDPMPPVTAVGKRPSPMAEARAAGWVMESAGHWMHPKLGDVQRTMDGTWTGTLRDMKVSGMSTMASAMAALAANAHVADTLAADAADTVPYTRTIKDSPETGAVTLEQAQAAARGAAEIIHECENCDAPILEGEDYSRGADGVVTCAYCSHRLAEAKQAAARYAQEPDGSTAPEFPRTWVA
jgi:DNA-directed RNA polymerase subunit RPC12/RpoP